MNDPDDWNADMDAWGLTDDQRTYHLWRLHAYHRRIEALHWRRWDRADVAQGWLGLAALVALAIALLTALR